MHPATPFSIHTDGLSGRPAYPAQTQKKPFAQSTIPPRGSRPLRKPKDSRPQSTNPVNAPVLNEMLASAPHVPLLDAQRQANDRKLVQQEIARMHSLRMLFVSSVVSPPDSLAMPAFPEIRPLEVTEHRDPAPPPAPGAIFAIRELESVPDIAPDEDAVLMASAQRY
jgi:hypothetical protein